MCSITVRVNRCKCKSEKTKIYNLQYRNALYLYIIEHYELTGMKPSEQANNTQAVAVLELLVWGQWGP